MTSVEEVEDEILRIRSQIASLQMHRANLSSVLLSSRSHSARLEQASVANDRHRRTALKIIKQQRDRNLENIYRTCAGVTAYKIKDPDPNAVDNGNILGVQIEVSIAGEHIDTYHVLFNRPVSQHKTMLKIHHHTIPPCIPLKPLTNKYLPVTQRDATELTEQNLLRFARCLRKELVSWHLRIAALEKLRLDAGLGDKAAREAREKNQYPIGRIMNDFTVSAEREHSDAEPDSDEEDPERHRRRASKVIDIEADIGVREVFITWSDGRSAMVRLAKDGTIDKGVVKNVDGVRIAELNGKVAGRIETLLMRLSGDVS